MDLKRTLAASGVEKGRTHPYLSNKELSSKQDRAPPKGIQQTSPV